MELKHTRLDCHEGTINDPLLGQVTVRIELYGAPIKEPKFIVLVKGRLVEEVLLSKIKSSVCRAIFPRLRVIIKIDRELPVAEGRIAICGERERIYNLLRESLTVACRKALES